MSCSERVNHSGYYWHDASFQQLGIWQACKVAIQPSLYNLLYTIRFDETLDVQHLSRAITAVINQHDALRSTFVWQNGELKVKVVEPCLSNITLENVDIETASAVDLLAKSFASIEYNLIEGPLYRFKLVSTSPTHSVLLCGFHHLVIDGTSIGRFVEELAAQVAKPLPLQEARVQYTEYCQWQQSQLNTQYWDQAIDYWKTTLEGQSGQRQIPSNKISSQYVDDLGGVYQHNLSHSVSTLLQLASLALGVSPFRIAFSAFFVFLNRLSKHDALMVATTLTGCSNPRFKQSIGLFVNTAIIKLELQNTLSFFDVIHVLSQQLDKAVSLQDYPHYLMYKNVPFDHEGANPFTPVSFTKLPTAKSDSASEVNTTYEVKHLEYASRDLSVFMQATNNSFDFTWHYRHAVLSKEKINGFAHQFEMILQGLLEQPKMPINQLSFISSSDRQKILLDWNSNDDEYANLKSVHALVEEQVARTPNDIAIVTPERSISYQALNNQANQLAWSLYAQGVRSGCYVPVLIQSSSALLVAELAIMKCGAAFCPIDADWPQQRVHNMLAQLNTSIVLVDDLADAQWIDKQYKTQLVRYQESKTNVENLKIAVAIDSPIYCIFTSGTTGSPKGAINQHRGILNRLYWMNKQFNTDAPHVVLATAPAYVDTLFWQYFWPLMNGGKVVILPKQDVVTPEKLVSTVVKQAVTFIDFVPSIFKHVVHYLARHPEAVASLNGLKHVFVGGEEMSADMVNQFRSLLPMIDVKNSYGPTETSIGIIFYDIQDEVANPVPLGFPISNVKTVILDENLNLVPIGQPGELCVGGVCVGLGYLNDKATTQRKFIANPFPELNCTTLYRTGDLVTYQANGAIQFLGRVDNQIKVRGVRMEPEEIETALKRHPQVEEAVIRLSKNSANEPHLVAYVTSSQQDNLTNAIDIYAFLKQQLPRQMLPSTFIKLAVMPLSQNGKIDRQALDEAVGQVLKSEKPFKAPNNSLELAIMQIWQQVLNQSEVSVDDDFFEDLGGDSLSALLFIAQFAKLQQKEMDIRLLYDASTISKLATRLNDAALAEEESTKREKAENQISDDFGQVLLAQRSYIKTWQGQQISEDALLFMLNSHGCKPPLFWCFQGHHEFAQLAKYLGEEQPVVGMRSGHLIMEYSQANIEALALAYASEMVKILPAGDFLVGGNCQGGRIALAIAKCLEKLGRPVKKLIMMEQSVFETYNGSLALIFGEASQYNPYLEHSNPHAFLSDYYEDFTIDLTSGGHGAFFQDANITSLSKIIQSNMENIKPLA